MEQYEARVDLDTMILATVADGSSYGYAIIEQLKIRAGDALKIPEGSVYPALHRLERDKLLASDWSMEAGRPRRVYGLTERGERELAARRARGRGFGPSIDRRPGNVNVDQLRCELRRSRIGGRLAGRIVAEFEDHLAVDPDANLGEPRSLARQFADELGTELARSAAIRTTAALAVCAVAMLRRASRCRATPTTGRTTTPRSAPFARLLVRHFAIFVAVFSGQVSLAAAVLAALGAIRLARTPVISATQAMMLRRRALVAWVSGAITIGSLALMGLVIPTAYGPNWALEVLVGRRGLWCRAAERGPDVLARGLGETDDRGSDVRRRRRPGAVPALRSVTSADSVAVRAAARRLVALVLTAVGVVNDDPLVGALRGGTDALACLAGFSLLGGYLGLVRPAGRATARVGSQATRRDVAVDPDATA